MITDEAVKQRQNARARLLTRVYEITKGRATHWVDLLHLAEDEGISEDEADAMYSYLMQANIIKPMGGGHRVTLSAYGVDVVEALLKKEPTEHFPPSVVMNFHGQVGGVQTGNGNTMEVNQNINPQIAEVVSLVKQLRSEAVPQLPAENREEAGEMLDQVAEMLETGTKRVATVQRLMHAVYGMLQTAHVVAYLPMVQQVVESLKR